MGGIAEQEELLDVALTILQKAPGNASTVVKSEPLPLQLRSCCRRRQYRRFCFRLIVRVGTSVWFEKVFVELG